MGQLRPTLGQVEEFLKRGKQRAAEVLSRLGKLDKYVEAQSTEIGVELLRDDVERMEYLMVKIWEEKATPQEKAEFRVLKGRITKISVRLDAWKKALDGINTQKA